VSAQDDLYERAAAEYGAALGRLARGHEAEPEKRRELLQEIHIALWRSFEAFEARCSLRTWVYRVAHNTGAVLGSEGVPYVADAWHDEMPLQAG